MLRIISLLVILFYVLIETVVSVAFADEFGIFGLFLEVTVTLVLGASLLSNFRGIILHSIRVLYAGKIDTAGVAIATLMQLVGAILLILPGVFSDLIGLILIGLGFIKIGFKSSMQNPSMRTHTYKAQENEGDLHHVPDEDIIDVEVISKRREI